jgi:hypothetical protein
MSYLSRDHTAYTGPTNLNNSFLGSSTNTSISPDTEPQRDYIAMYNDWDLDAAFLNASTPYLSIVVETPSYNRLISHVELTSPIIGSPVANDEWEVINSYVSKNSSSSSKLNVSARRRMSAVNNSPAATLTQNQSKGHSLSSASSHLTSSPNAKQQPVYNLNLSNNKSVNIMNLDPNSNGRSSLT